MIFKHLGNLQRKQMSGLPEKEQDKKGQKAGITNEHEETFGNDGYSHYLDNSDCFTTVYI